MDPFNRMQTMGLGFDAPRQAFAKLHSLSKV